MNSTSVPQFGTRDPAVDYVDRPGAYAIIQARGSVAVVRTRSGLHLPGGAVENGEALEETLAREVLEECGWAIHDATYVCSAIQYVCAPGEGYFAKRCTYFSIESFEPSVSAVASAGHEVRWVELACAKAHLLHESHRWALAQWNSLTNADREGPPGA